MDFSKEKSRTKFIEGAMYIMNERDDISTSSDLGLALIAVWNLMPDRNHGLSIGSGDGFDIKLKISEIFSAHAHPNEPLVPSPEDIHTKSDMESGSKKSFHYIVDRFMCRRY